MSLLPMIDGIETLINDGANAATIKPRLFDLRDKVKALERDIAQFEVKYDAAVQLNAQQQQEIAGLKAAQAPAQPQITEEEISVIRVISSAGSRAFMNDMVVTLEMPETKIRYLSNNLKKRGYADSAGGSVERGMMWYLTDEGTEYAVKNNLFGDGPPEYTGFPN